MARKREYMSRRPFQDGGDDYRLQSSGRAHEEGKKLLN
jgi:hypothetical protein